MEKIGLNMPFFEAYGMAVDNFYKINVSLDKNAKFYWRVKARDIINGQQSSFSEIGAFQIK